MSKATTRRSVLKLFAGAPLLTACNVVVDMLVPAATPTLQNEQVVNAADASAGNVRMPQPTPALFNPLDYPLTIEAQRKQTYPGSAITIEQRLDPEPTYERFVVSYRSEGLKIFALMTMPLGEKPADGWPVILFNHGYIPPSEYRTTERYVSYVDAFAHHGYIVFKSDYRGHGDSEGEPRSYGYPDFTTDVLNAVTSIRNYPQANPKRIGMWGHSMGGYLTLRVMVISKDVRAGNIWAGVVGTYPEIAELWFSQQPIATENDPRSWREAFFALYGPPEMNPAFWNAVSATSYLKDLSGPIQLHHAVEDADVPISQSRKLNERIRAVNGTVEQFEYTDDNHNLSVNFETAMERSLSFFQKNLA